MPRVARQHRRIDAELGERTMPFTVVIESEHDIVICSDRKPAIGLDFGVELTWCPAGIAEGEEALARTLISADGAQDLKARCDRKIAVDMESGLLAIVGRVEHKTSACFDRASKMHRMRIGDSARFDVELREQLSHGQRAQPLIDNQAHRACVVAVGAEINDRPSKPRVQHLWHRHQEIPRERLPTDHHLSHLESRLPPLRLYTDFVARARAPNAARVSALGFAERSALCYRSARRTPERRERKPRPRLLVPHTPPEGYHDHQCW